MSLPEIHLCLQPTEKKGLTGQLLHIWHFSFVLFFFSVRSGRKQLASIVNFLLSVVATFAFGYVASQYAFPSEAVVGI